MSVPSSSNLVAWGANTTFVMSGSQTMTAIASFTAKWGYKIHEEVTTGTSLPYLGTGVFHGDLNIETLASSDSRWETLVSVTSGIVPTFGMTWREFSPAGSGRTWTMSGKFTEYEKTNQKDQVVFYKAKAILSNEPTVAFT